MKTNEQPKKPANKQFGRIYTPQHIVDVILDYVGYTTDILQKHIIDNSCGDGAFLCEIVRRYCTSFLANDKNLHKLALELQVYIHGIELDPIEHQRCIENLNQVISTYGLSPIDWDVICADTLTQHQHDKRMDFVVGNPPYVRVHNLDKSYDAVKQYSFTQSGMTDLFIVFFEIGFNMLDKTGKMCLITPSSWLSSRAGEALRKYILQHHNLSGVIDLEHYQAFQATTYTLISRFDSMRNDSIDYQTYDGVLHKKRALKYSDFNINNSFFLSTPFDLKRLRDIRLNTTTSLVKVKNGYATLADKIFIGAFPFDAFTINVVKASTGEWRKCIFPYNKQGKPLSEEVLKDSQTYKYLLEHKEQLTNGRDSERSEWYLFGRSQAILDTFKNKIAINSIIKDLDSIKLVAVPAGCGVYSGLYILTDVLFEHIQSILLSADFLEYIKILKNYKSGGYYTFSSKDLELFINYKLQQDEQSRLSISSGTLF